MYQPKLSKKFIKRLFFEPKKACCPICGTKLFLLPEDENVGKILFKCMSFSCGNIIDVSDYKSKYAINRLKMYQTIVPFKNVKDTPKSLTLTHMRISDKFYIVKGDVTYNPIKRIKCSNKEMFTLSNTSWDESVHRQLLEIIIKNNAKK